MFALRLLTSFLLVTATVQAQSPEIKIVSDLSYKHGDQLTPYETERCKLDLYLPTGVKDFPTLVWLHGGGLTAGSKDGKQQPPIARHFAEQGIAMAVVNYRLSPHATYPAYLEDSAAAFAWVEKHIAEYGGAMNRVFLGGHSAGAYLTLMVSMDDQYLKASGSDISHIAGIVPVAGQTLTHFTIRIERGLPKDQIIADAASPLYHVRKDAPPMLILYAEKDMAMRAEENELLAAALRHAGHSKLTVKMIQDRDHGSVAHDMANTDDDAFAEVLNFIQQAKVE
ncbi:Acetyl esterase/lipase [Prosthecobacter debontii]|uniref:Acetyl esterase/lipase n=1 Tax=Prosthecobacter debontii TaxID=48467 RepID=A0A1T4WVV7_9BACT|nr:alpha/beta hydrolase [Prosthecobacter debontii]SKA81522.1 Acetyl esterase/lipase [Prosthecobacter debontii]